MGQYQKIKGTQDFYGVTANKLRTIEMVSSKVAKTYGFKEIITPIFENSNVFIKNVGEESDVVKKEMYTFKDKGGRSITLRPEGTAAVARSFIENKMYANPGMTKYYYYGPMFRYERPQTGRYREFNQFGVEAYGSDSPLLDSDIILSGYNIFKSLGIKNVVLHINSIGDAASRLNYSSFLQTYFKEYIDSMCIDCQRRLTTNPMRILDCKVDKENIAIKNAPNITDFLTNESKEYFSNVLKTLDALEIPYIVDTRLVRGLDYYTDTVFEFVINSNDELNGLALGGGGKYANLINSMVGKNVSGIGYAFGLERISAVMDKQNAWKDLETITDCVILGLDDESKISAMLLSNELRCKGLTVEIDYASTKLKPQFKLAERVNCKYIIIIGEEERKTGLYMVKNTVTKTQKKISKDKIYEYIEEEK